MRKFSVLIKPASSICNLKCKYCFYNDLSSLRDLKSFGKMDRDTTFRMVDNIYAGMEDGDELTLAFQGGEPTVAGLDYFQTLIEYVGSQEKDIKVNYSIQTNGTMIDDSWCQFLKKNNFLVGLSIDGPKQFHDSGRVNWFQKGTFDEVIKTKKLFDDYDVDYNVLTVLTNEIAKKPKEIFDFLLEENIGYVQFIPCLEEFNLCKPHEYKLTPELFYDFYDQIIDLWLEQLEQGRYISIKLLDDIFNLLVKGEETACGMLGKCQIQFVIEGDGSVYPCDFYVLDDYYLGNIKDKTLSQLSAQPNAWKFLFNRPEGNLYCQSCPYQNICGNGCKRMNKAMYVSEDRRMCGYQNILDKFIPIIPNIIENIEKIISGL